MNQTLGFALEKIQQDDKWQKHYQLIPQQKVQRMQYVYVLTENMLQRGTCSTRRWKL